MCVLFLALDRHPRYPLVLAANRDEFYRRPAAPAAWWGDCPDVLAGRDLEAGGTWMGVTRAGRWAALTNVRDFRNPREGRVSRGVLVRDYLCGNEPPEGYAEAVSARLGDFAGFNLLVGDRTEVWYVSTHTDAPEALEPGLYGLSNATLGAPWPKVTRGLDGFRQALAADEPEPADFLAVLRDDTPAPDDRLPDTGIGRAWERLLSSLFIVGEDYGTRASMALLLDCEGGGRFVERTIQPGGVPGRIEDVRF